MPASFCGGLVQGEAEALAARLAEIVGIFTWTVVNRNLNGQ